MMRQRDLPRHGPLAAADHAHSGDGVVRSPERARGDEGGAPPGEAGDAIDTGGLQRFRQAHRRRDGGEATREHQLPRPGWPEEQLIRYLC